MKIISGSLVLLSVLLSFTGCTREARANLQTVKADTLIITPMRLMEKPEKKASLVTDYADFQEQYEKLGLKSNGVIAFDKVYFLKHDVLVVSLSTNPSYSYGLNKILVEDKTTTIHISQSGPESANLPMTATCLLIGIDKDQLQNIETYSVVMQKIVTK